MCSSSRNSLRGITQSPSPLRHFAMERCYLQLWWYFFFAKNRKIKCRKCDAPHLTGRQFLKSLIENRQISDKEIISLIELVVSRSAVVIHQRNNRNHKNCNQNADHQSWILIKQRIYLYINKYCKRLPFHLVKSRLALGSPSWWFVCLFVRSSQYRKWPGTQETGCC